MSLDQVLNGVPENTPRPDLPAEPEVPEQPAPETAEPPKGEEVATPPVAEPVKTVPLAALEDERRKRQELERRLQQQPQQEPKAGFWDNPEAHLQGVQQSAHLQALAVKLDITEELAKAKYADYDNQLKTFAELVQENPDLRVQMLQARNPAEFAYSVAKNHATVKQAGSIEQIREQIRAEERTKIEAEMKAKAEAEAKKRAAIPETLTGVQTAAPKNAEFLGPTPLDAILK